MSALPATESDITERVDLLERQLDAERAERKTLQAQLDVLSGGHDSAAFAERLERLIDQRTHALSLARDEAVAASHSKSSFLANMSHEIRTPLTSIIGFAEIMQDPTVPLADKTDAAKIIVRNGRHLLDVINDILDLSKIESNQVALELIEVRLPKLLSDIEALASSRAQQKALLFTIEHHLPLPPTLLTDPVRLKQILLNFCSNAVKFSTEGEVRLDVRYDAASGQLQFDVTDSGIGMSRLELARLFKPFVQADVSTTRKFGGTGLGLYISKQLADMLGGEIRVVSAPDLGSRFTLSVPIGIRPRATEMLTAPRDFDDFQPPSFEITTIEVPSLSGRVLVAEDGADNQRLLGAYLRQAGLAFDIVKDGSLAVERARAHDYALVLMDIQMPVMDGVTATRLLRESGYRGPIVALTANVMQADVARYRQCGCNDVLAKPIDRHRFYDVLKTFVHDAVSPDLSREDAYAAELARLADAFVAELPGRALALEAAAQAADAPRLKLLLHALKGTAGSYGLAHITAMAAAAEVRIEAGQMADVTALCSVLSTSAGHRASVKAPR